MWKTFQLLSTNARPEAVHNGGKIAEFPGAKAPYVTEIKVLNETSYDPIPIYRVLDNNGEIIDSKEDPNIDKDVLVNMYKTMVQLSQMDKILYESQRYLNKHNIIQYFYCLRKQRPGNRTNETNQWLCDMLIRYLYKQL